VRELLLRDANGLRATRVFSCRTPPSVLVLRPRLKSYLVHLGADGLLPRRVVFALINLLGLRHA
jgi:hypothetical protein